MAKDLTPAEDLQYYEEKINSIYNELSALLEVDVRGASMLINNESIIKERMLQLISIGYNKRIIERKELMQAKKGKIVIQLDTMGTVIKRHTEGIRATERKFKMSQGAINNAILNGTKAGGFYWVKEEDYRK